MMQSFARFSPIITLKLGLLPILQPTQTNLIALLIGLRKQKMSFSSRTVKQVVLSVDQPEGVGVRVRRSIGRPELRNFDPFLLLDEFKAGKPAGFRDHPHRGFETVTYMLPSSKGSFQHEDFCGHRGVIGPGDLQWMTAGRGIVHAEMPLNDELSHGLQLWVNLEKKDKMCPPQYQELKNTDVPKVTKNKVTAVVIAGEALGTVSKIYTRTPTHFIHFIMEPNSKVEQPIPSGWAAFAYTLDGKVKFGGSGGDFIEPHNTVTFNSQGDGVIVETTEEVGNFVLISGKPIGEPIIQQGPFVMTLASEIMEARDDYYKARNGFENAKNWESTIAKSLAD